jgi:hypothetical protein
LRGDSVRFVLARAEDAATRLGVMLAELAEALQLHILTRLRLRPTRHVVWLQSAVHDELW